jgi:hypothetical protein
MGEVHREEGEEGGALMATKPPKLTPELIKEICDNLATGMLRGDAAALAGVEREVFADWMGRAEKGEEPFVELRQEMAKTELQAQRRLLSKISLAAANDPKFAVWMLGHRWSRGWGERERGEAPRRLSPREAGEKDTNALAKGIGARYPLLSWESSAQYQELLAGLLAEHLPQGPTEQRLVEELASIWLRKSRVRLAEAAAHRRGLKNTLSPYSKTVNSALAHVTAEEHPDWVVEAIQTTEDDTAKELAVFESVKAKAGRALDIVTKSRGNAYQAGMAALQGATREWWEENLATKGKGYTADAAGLKRFLEGEALPWLASRGQELSSRPLVREQAFGEALEPKHLEHLARYEAHLDREMDRTLGTLLRLQELRRTRTG